MHRLGRCNLHDYSNKCLHFTLNDSNESLNHDNLILLFSGLKRFTIRFLPTL